MNKNENLIEKDIINKYFKYGKLLDGNIIEKVAGADVACYDLQHNEFLSSILGFEIDPSYFSVDINIKSKFLSEFNRCLYCTETIHEDLVKRFCPRCFRGSYFPHRFSSMNLNRDKIMDEILESSKEINLILSNEFLYGEIDLFVNKFKAKNFGYEWISHEIIRHTLNKLIIKKPIFKREIKITLTHSETKFDGSEEIKDYDLISLLIKNSEDVFKFDSDIKPRFKSILGWRMLRREWK